jgi:hypothetical protein
MLARAYFRRTHRNALFVAWHTAAFSRAERLPSLQSLLADPPSEEERKADLDKRAREFREMVANSRRARQLRANG